MRQLSSREDGAALVLALVAVALLTSLGATIFQQVKYEIRLSSVEASGEQALSAAEAGWNVAFAWIRAGALAPGETRTLVRDLTYDDAGSTVKTGEYTTEFERLATPNENCYRILSTGRAPGKGGGTLRREVWGWVRDNPAAIRRWSWCYDCNQGEVGC